MRVKRQDDETGAHGGASRVDGACRAMSPMKILGQHAGRGRQAWGAAGLALAVLGSAPRALAFRSAGDLPDFDQQPLVAFAKAPVSLELSGFSPPDLDHALVELEIQRAAETWAAPGCTGLSFVFAGASDQAAEPGDGRNTIQWVSDWKSRGYPADSPGATDVQYAKDKAGRWTIAEADTYLNLDFEWTTGVPTGDGKSLQAVLTHELGHTLGLLHPCELNGADGAPKCSASADFASEEMYPVYSPDQTVLSDDDIAGVCFLYPPGCNEASCPEGTICANGSCQAPCGDTVCPPSTTCVKEQCVAASKDCGARGCVGQSCREQSDCGRHELCDGRVCARGEQALGDVCSTTSECFDGACVDGACAEGCAPGDTCSTGGACDVNTAACTESLAPMGQKCEFSTDCRGAHCLRQNEGEPVCTRSCASGQPPCPAGWACRHAEGQLVCAPEAPPDDGCNIAPAQRASSLPYGLGVASLCFASWRAWRRRRFPRTRS